MLEFYSPREETDDVCCPDVHEFSPWETILAVVKQTNQPKVKEEIHLLEPDQVEDSSENQQ